MTEEMYRFCIENNAFVQNGEYVSLTNIVTGETVQAKMTKEVYDSMRCVKDVRIDYNNINPDWNDLCSERIIRSPCDEIKSDETVHDVSDNQCETSQQSTKWFTNSILCLIDAYKNKYYKIKNSTDRNAKVWEEISVELLKNKFKYSAKQCTWKFAKLKELYHKAKHAQSTRNTGGKPVIFEYFQQMDDIFGTSHANGLPITASSSKYNPPQNLEAEDTLEISNKGNSNISKEETSEETPPKRRRLTVSEALKQSLTTLRTDREKRHSEQMGALEKLHQNQDEQLKILKEAAETHTLLMNRLIDKL